MGDVIVEDVIERLMVRFHAKNEAELARRMQIGQSTISTWKRRGYVPDRYNRIADGEHTHALGTTPLNWGPYEQSALGLAISRYARVYSEAVTSSDFETTMRMVACPGDLWTLFRSAQNDLWAMMDGHDGEQPLSPLAILVHRDCQDPEKAVDRDRNLIEGGRSGVEC